MTGNAENRTQQLRCVKSGSFAAILSILLHTRQPLPIRRSVFGVRGAEFAQTPTSAASLRPSGGSRFTSIFFSLSLQNNWPTMARQLQRDYPHFTTLSVASAEPSVGVVVHTTSIYSKCAVERPRLTRNALIWHDILVRKGEVQHKRTPNPIRVC